MLDMNALARLTSRRSTAISGLFAVVSALSVAIPATLAVTAVGCGGAPAQSANPKRALDERRAVQIIISAFKDEGTQAVRGRRVKLAGGKTIEVDVGAPGKKFGVAYTTPAERRKIGKSIPSRDASMGDALILVRGTGDDREARILVLNDSDYFYDDQVGTDHEHTTIAAEGKLRRDVRDFVVRAKAEQWP